MTVADWTAELLELGAHVGPGLSGEPTGVPMATQLPAPHQQLLASLNGLTVYQGAFRLLGVGRDEPPLDLASWNARQTWRFAWDERVEPYLIFGETGWGDQYAYRRRASGGLDQEVYFLEGTLLRPEVIAGSFEEFLEIEFLRNARDPYDPMTVEAVARLGALDPGEHWAYAPSIALGGVESVDNVVRLPAATAMTFAGDIATALAAAPPGSEPTGVETWVDELGRSRLQVTFNR